MNDFVRFSNIGINGLIVILMVKYLGLMLKKRNRRRKKSNYIPVDQTAIVRHS